MNPSSKYWVNKFFNDLDLSIFSNINELNLIYNKISYTGIIYGVTIDSITYEHNDTKKWNDTELAKIIYLETVSLIIFSQNKIERKHQIIEELYNFLLFINNENNNHNNILDIEEKAYEIEKYINNLFSDKSIKSYFLINNQKLNFIFVDFHLLIKYLNKKIYSPDKIFFEKKNIINNILSLIKKVIKFDNNTNTKEQFIYNQYIDSAKFYLNDSNYNFEYSENDYSIFDNYIIKKIVLDIAILFFLEDNKIDEEEREFLINLSENLKLDTDEIDKSIINLENLLIKNYDAFFYMSKSKLPVITNFFTQRLLKIFRKNKEMIVNEIKESGELLLLIRKSLNSELTNQEKQKINEQIKDIIKSIPALAIFMIPGGSVLLPIIYKVLPDELLYPSSFKNKKQINDDTKN